MTLERKDNLLIARARYLNRSNPLIYFSESNVNFFSGSQILTRMWSGLSKRRRILCVYLLLSDTFLKMKYNILLFILYAMTFYVRAHTALFRLKLCFNYINILC